MNETKFSVFQNALDDKYAQEAVTYKKSSHPYRAGLLAACACVALIGVFAWKPWRQTAKDAAAPQMMFSAAGVTEESTEVFSMQTTDSNAATEEPMEYAMEEACMEAEDAAAPEAPAPAADAYAAQSMMIPENVEIVSEANILSDDRDVSCVVFILDDVEYEYRAAASSESEPEDISGIDHSGCEKTEVLLNDIPAIILQNLKTGEICVLWDNAGETCSLTAAADAEVLIETAEKLIGTER